LGDDDDAAGLGFGFGRRRRCGGLRPGDGDDAAGWTTTLRRARVQLRATTTMRRARVRARVTTTMPRATTTMPRVTTTTRRRRPRWWRLCPSSSSQSEAPRHAHQSDTQPGIGLALFGLGVQLTLTRVHSPVFFRSAEAARGRAQATAPGIVRWVELGRPRRPCQAGGSVTAALCAHPGTGRALRAGAKDFSVCRLSWGTCRHTSHSYVRIVGSATAQRRHFWTRCPSVLRGFRPMPTKTNSPTVSFLSWVLRRGLYFVPPSQLCCGCGHIARRPFFGRYGSLFVPSRTIFGCAAIPD
jgi:hypothetical protein